MNYDDVATRAEIYKIAKRNRERAHEALEKMLAEDGATMHELAQAKAALEAAASSGVEEEARADERGKIVNYLLSAAAMTGGARSADLRDYAARIRKGAHEPYPSDEPALAPPLAVRIPLPGETWQGSDEELASINEAIANRNLANPPAVCEQAPDLDDAERLGTPTAAPRSTVDEDTPF